MKKKWKEEWVEKQMEKRMEKRIKEKNARRKCVMGKNERSKSVMIQEGWKKRAAGVLLAGAIGLGFGLNGCGASADYSADSKAMDAGAASGASEMTMYSDDSYENYGGLSSSENYDDYEDYEDYDEEWAEETEAESGAAEVSVDESAASSQKKSQKLIYTYNYSVETKEFDKFTQDILDQVTALGGYVEHSETNGNSLYGTRYASMTLRIPSEKMSQLLSFVGKESNVTYSSQSSENVTLRYVDMESHVKALRTEQEALLGLLEKATKVSDIISLQSQLTEVRYEIESYESQLRTYDNLVDYSSLYLDISEVERTTNITDTKTTFGEEVKARFGDNLYAVGQGFRSFAIWFIGSLPVLAVLAVCAVIVVWIIRRIRNRVKKNGGIKRQKNRKMLKNDGQGAEEADGVAKPQDTEDESGK